MGRKQTKITKSARGEACTIRLPGCDGGGETAVLCHYSLSGLSGGSFKAADCQGAYGCYSCHQVVDGQKPRPEGYTRAEVRLAHAEGVFRTQAILKQKGLLTE